MSFKPHSIHAYAAFDTHISKVERWLLPRLHAVLGGDARTVHHRVVQRLVELSLGPYVTQLAQRQKQGQPFLHPEGVQLELNGISIDTASGKVGLRWPFLLRACVDFTAHWLHALYSIARMGTGVARGKATLVFGVGAESLFHGDDDRRFAEYCSKGPIAPLRAASRLLVQHITRSGTSSDDRISYARHPFEQLAREMRLTWRERAILLLRHLLMPARYVWAMLKCRPVALLSRDFAMGPLMAALDKSGMIEAVVFTNSNYTTQPLWARAQRSYKTHMVWYSQNAYPFVMKSDNISADLPSYRYMQVDAHWVWTEGFRRYLIARGGRMLHIEVIGPVMWYLPSCTGRPPRNFFRIAVFDITPISDGYAESIGLLENYYCASTAMGFLEGVLEAAEGMRESTGQKCVVSLKHKRHYSVTHDRSYIDRVRDSVEQGEVELIPFDTNVYDFISQCDVAVVIPNSSPVYIASALQIPSIYFDPTMEMRPNFEQATNVFFASGKDDLKQQLVRVHGAWQSREGGFSRCHF